ncbi:MAG TPA: hypothetical protein VFS57_06300 [Gemmatimonadaceae bacterium]|nr:hypothetical protein [Gemmatimonadaceae bacterium]
MTTFTYDLAISAVPCDAALVGDLLTELGTRLRTEPVWEGHAPPSGDVAEATLGAQRSRLALVLYHRLWQHDAGTMADATLLRERLRLRPRSVCVMTLDDTPVPSWLAKARRYDVAAHGLNGAADFAAEAVASSGGSLTRAAQPAVEAESATRWPEGPAPFLAQPRAHSALRRELDALAAQLETQVDRWSELRPDGTFELLRLPYRLVARFDAVALTFSWVTGRLATVANGRLLAIEWSGITNQVPGVSAFKSAASVREHDYRVEGGDPEHWRWRMDDPNGRAFSTTNLAAYWLASLSIALAD